MTDATQRCSEGCIDAPITADLWDKREERSGESLAYSVPATPTYCPHFTFWVCQFHRLRMPLNMNFGRSPWAVSCL